jgi:hypothetical protein
VEEGGCASGNLADGGQPLGTVRAGARIVRTPREPVSQGVLLTLEICDLKGEILQELDPAYLPRAKMGLGLKMLECSVVHTGGEGNTHQVRGVLLEEAYQGKELTLVHRVASLLRLQLP